MAHQFGQHCHGQVVFDELPRKGMPELMTGHRDPGLSAVVAQALLQAVDGHRLPAAVRAERGVRRARHFLEPAVEDGIGISAQIDDPLFAAFAFHPQARRPGRRGGGQNVSALRADNFADPQASTQHQREPDLIPGVADHGPELEQDLFTDIAR